MKKSYQLATTLHLFVLAIFQRRTGDVIPMASHIGYSNLSTMIISEAVAAAMIARIQKCARMSYKIQQREILEIIAATHIIN